jgi:hypothetical protein
LIEFLGVPFKLLDVPSEVSLENLEANGFYLSDRLGDVPRPGNDVGLRA